MMHAALGAGRSLLIGGRWEAADETMAVVDPWTGRPIDAVACADAGHVERAVASALRASKIDVHRPQRTCPSRAARWCG